MEKLQNYVYLSCQKCKGVFHFALLLVHKIDGRLCPQCVDNIRLKHKEREEYFDQSIDSLLKQFQITVHMYGKQPKALPNELRQFEECSICNEVSLCVSLQKCKHAYCALCFRFRDILPICRSKNLKHFEVLCPLCDQKSRRVKDHFQYYEGDLQEDKKDLTLSIGGIINAHYGQIHPTCPECSEEFDSGERWPVIMPCRSYGHVVCKTCLLDALREWIEI